MADNKAELDEIDAYHDRLWQQRDDARIDDDYREPTEAEMVDSVLGNALLGNKSDCADVICEAAADEREALMELMCVGVDLEAADVSKLTVSQLIALATCGLELRNSIVNNLKENHDLKYLAEGK